MFESLKRHRLSGRGFFVIFLEVIPIKWPSVFSVEGRDGTLPILSTSI
jgi:hypothetical protein